MIVEIFTDGACRGNPGPGGWGVLVRYGKVEKALKGAEAHTTNNRMELTAAIKGLNALTKPSNVHLTTDSLYLKKGISEWLPNWKAHNWRRSGKKPVKNTDLWQELDCLARQHRIEWYWVKGHSGHRENEVADSLANQAIDELTD